MTAQPEEPATLSREGQPSSPAMIIPEQADMIGEACAGCGKEIGMLDASVYIKKPDDDIGQSYHIGCYMRASALVGVQRPEDVVEQCALIAENYQRDASFDDSVIGAGEHTANQINIANAIRQLALPHTGQPQEGCADLETIADAIDAARYAHPDHPRERPRPFVEADRGDREYAARLARAARAVIATALSAFITAKNTRS